MVSLLVVALPLLSPRCSDPVLNIPSAYSVNLINDATVHQQSRSAVGMQAPVIELLRLMTRHLFPEQFGL